MPLRTDVDAVQIRGLARTSKDAAQTRRLLTLAAIYDGARRSETAALGGVTVQIVRDWVVKFNAQGLAGLIDRKAPGQPSRLNDTHRAALAVVIESGPIPAVHGVVRWHIIDLCQWLWDTFQVSIAKQTLSRELRKMGFRIRETWHERAGDNKVAVQRTADLPLPAAEKQGRNDPRVVLKGLTSCRALGTDDTYKQ